MAPLVNIVIPTFNRADLLPCAVEAALSQSHPRKFVTVIDDASTDGTAKAMRPYLGRNDLLYLRLSRNLGTAKAKNVALALTKADAYTFHDSDDIPHRDKVLRQARALTRTDVEASPMLNWTFVARRAGDALTIGAVLSHHEMIMPDGSREEVRRELSLIDDLLPNLQMNAGPPGDWTHVNSGLFRSSVFERLGGFEDCVEEDREFRNRLILSGEVVWVLREILLTKIETEGSLTRSVGSDYTSARRAADRRMVWDRVSAWRNKGAYPTVPIALPDFAIDEISASHLLGPSSALATDETRRHLEGLRRSWSTLASETSVDA